MKTKTNIRKNSKRQLTVEELRSIRGGDDTQKDFENRPE